MNERNQVLDTPRGPLRFTIAHRPRITRRMHLEIDDAGDLRVVVPCDWPDFYTRRLLRKHLGKVQRFLDRARAHTPERLRYGDGARHLFRGRKIVLALRTGPGKRHPPVLHQGTLSLVLPDPDPDRIRKTLRAWYRAQAEPLFAERLAYWQRRTPWAHDQDLTLRLRRMKKTWGTCSKSGVIRLNTHLVKAPPDSLDYVIAHELCHVEEMNHGPGFYALQETLYPEWRQAREHLRRFGPCYTQE